MVTRTPRVKEPKQSAKDLTDEEVLKEFVKRFQCDGAVLVYLEGNSCYGFGRWVNSMGRKWVSSVWKLIKEDDSSLDISDPDTNEGGETKQL